MKGYCALLMHSILLGPKAAQFYVGLPLARSSGDERDIHCCNCVVSDGDDALSASGAARWSAPVSAPTLPSEKKISRSISPGRGELPPSASSSKAPSG